MLTELEIEKRHIVIVLALSGWFLAKHWHIIVRVRRRFQICLHCLLSITVLHFENDHGSDDGATQLSFRSSSCWGREAFLVIRPKSLAE